MDNQRVLLDHQRLRYTMLISQVVKALDSVLDSGILPQSYYGTFKEVTILFDEIIKDTIKYPDGISHRINTDVTVWFRDVVEKHPDLVQYVNLCGKLEGITSIMSELTEEALEPRTHRVEWIMALQNFFMELERAASKEYPRMAVVQSLDPMMFPETSTRLQ